MLECVNCHAQLGEDAKELPFVTHDGESWCPQCFVWKRAATEPDRYPPGTFTAIKCGKCGVTSVDTGRALCGQCGSHNVVALVGKTVAHGRSRRPPPPPTET